MQNITLSISLLKIFIILLFIMKTLFIIFFKKLDRYIEESNGNKYLIFVSTNNNKEVLTKYPEVDN